MKCHLEKLIRDDREWHDDAVAVFTVIRGDFYQGRVSTALCKSCLDFWLDNADEDDSLEPDILEFIGDFNATQKPHH
jgi:hypothetical protein